MPLVRKTIYTFVVYHEADNAPLDMEQAMIESTDGSMVGDVINERTESVHPDKLRDELLAIGNDGEFFNMEDS